MRDRLSANPVAIQMPIGAEDQFRGVIDLITMRADLYNVEDKGAEPEVVEIPDDLRADAEARRATK